MLAESLTARKVLFRPENKRISSSSLITQPKIQTADALLQLKKLRFDIPKIDSLIELAATDLCCISGYGATLLLTRLCVRSLLPQRHGGLDSPHVIVADTGNQTDVYSVVNFARQYGMSKEDVAERILVVRAFTVYQVRRLLSVELPKFVGKYHVQGPVLTENEDYTITVSITSIDNTVQPQPPSDDFLLPSPNSTANSLVPVA
jgi:hypothetical protein